MTVLVFPSKLEGEPLERHETTARMSVHDWLTDNVKSYEVRDVAPLSVSVNGTHVEPKEWALTYFSPGDEVCIYPEPKGVEVVYAAIAGIVAAIAIVVLQPSVQQDKGRAQTAGSPLDEASIKGNKIKINQVIREVAGTRKIYPDYLVPLHRYFEGPREQVTETHLSFGKGEFDIPTSRILIGDTPIISLGDGASFTIYQPGASVAADARAVWWHSAPEIGATSTGTAGLELKLATTATDRSTSSQYIFSGNTIAIPSGAGSFPADWSSGMIVRVIGKYPYTVTDGMGAGVRDIISGDIAQLGFTSGDLIEMVGDNAGFYIVDTFDGMAGTMTLDYPDSSPAASLVTGSLRMAISYRGMRYRILSVGPNLLTLDRLTDTGATDLAWPGFSDITLDDATITLDPSNLVADTLGPFAACPEGELTTELEWDVFFPGGLVGLAPDGERYQISASHLFEYRDIKTAGAWTEITKVHQGSSLDAQGFTNSVTLPYAMRPECRMRKVFIETGGRLPDEYRDDTQWYGLRAKLSAPTSYAGISTMTVKVSGGGKLSAQSEQLVSALVTRKLPTRVDGAWTAPVVTNDIAPWVAYIAKSLGYTDDDLDLEELDRLDAIWQARGDKFDTSFESATTAKEALNTVLRAGFSELTIDRGLIRPVRDEPRSVYEHMYSPFNMKEALVRQFTAFTPDSFDGVDVEYTDSRTWTVETVECRLPGDLGRRVEKIQAEGVTDRDRAWRIGMRQRRANKYRRYVYSFDTELDALNSRYLSYVALCDNVPGQPQSALLNAIAPSGGGHLLVSSEALDWSAGGVHRVALRRLDGTVSGPYVATRIDDFRMTITGLDFVPNASPELEPAHLLFGPNDKWSYPALITEISPSGSTGASVAAVNYSPLVYEDDDNFAPA